ncbi:MAG TPA: hypothetical protein VHZ95_17460, partial [Polyangiales bacterium]|nr:hypothetical protein [Polyangiales bacterium]
MSLHVPSSFLCVGLIFSPCSAAFAQASASSSTPATAQPADHAQPQTTPTLPKPMAAPGAQLLQDDRALARWVLAHSQDVAAAAAEVLGARAAGRGARLIPNPVV